MENISRGPTFGDFVTIRTEASMQDVTVVGLQSTRVQTPLSPFFKCNVLRESLSQHGQNFPCATLKRERVVSYLYISLITPYGYALFTISNRVWIFHAFQGLKIDF
jgi:hypothetical protein